MEQSEVVKDNPPAAVVKETFTWKIPKFDRKQKYCYKAQMSNGVRFVLDFLPQEKTQQSSAVGDHGFRYCVFEPNFYFENIPKDDKKFFKFTMKTAKGGETFKTDYTEISPAGTLKMIPKNSNFLRKSASSFLNNGELTLIIDVAMRDAVTEDDEPKTCVNATKSDKEEPKPSKDELCRANSDFTLTGSDFKYWAHKSLIADYSPVLAKLIKEAGSKKEAVVKGVGRNTFYRVLQFIYKGVVDVDAVQRLEELIAVADKLQVKGLKSKCEETAKEMLERSNANFFYKLAKKHHFESLKQAIRSLVNSSLDGLKKRMEELLRLETAEDFKKIFDTIAKLETFIETLPAEQESSEKDVTTSPLKSKRSGQKKRKKTLSRGSVGSLEAKEKVVTASPKKKESSVDFDGSTSRVPLIDKNVDHQSLNFLNPIAAEKNEDKRTKSVNQKPTDKQQNSLPAAASCHVGGNFQKEKRITYVEKRKHQDPLEILGDYASEWMDETPVEDPSADEPKEKLSSFRDFMSSVSKS